MHAARSTHAEPSKKAFSFSFDAIKSPVSEAMNGEPISSRNSLLKSRVPVAQSACSHDLI
jgi:hypothetical protein